MARKSRKQTAAPMPAPSLYVHVALYIRLSVEDNKKRGCSVENQKLVLNDFLSDKPDFVVYDTYIDNGATGTNFHRPGFQQMLSDIEAGHINCVIVKDLSRLGRNSIDTGYYIEQYKVIVEIVDRIADDDLKLARLREGALGGFQRLDLGNVRLGGVVEDKAHARYAVGYRRNVLFAADVLKQQPRVLFVFTHDVFLLLPGRAGIFELVHTSSAYSHRIPDLFIQVNMLLQKSSAVRLFSALLTSCPLEI